MPESLDALIARLRELDGKRTYPGEDATALQLADSGIAHAEFDIAAANAMPRLLDELGDLDANVKECDRLYTREEALLKERDAALARVETLTGLLRRAREFIDGDGELSRVVYPTLKRIDAALEEK